MKKIIKISILAFGICFMAGKADAQLSSDQPAMTAAQMTELQTRAAAPSKKATTTSPQTASAQAPAPGVITAARAQIKPAIISDQGGVVPSAVVIPEIKAAVVPTQETETEKEKKKAQH